MSSGAVRQKQGVVLTIMILLLMSGALRLALGIEGTLAFAEQADDAAEIETENQVPDMDVPALVEALSVREAAVRSREQALEDRMLALELAEEEVTKRLAQLEEAEERLAALIAQAETASEGDIAALTAVYENMKPAEAAILFEQMDPQFSSGFLVRMRPEAAAAILAGLEPSTAYSISAIIAGRNANTPSE